MKIIVRKNGKELGPYNIDDAQGLLLSGKFHHTDTFRVIGETNFWLPLEQLSDEKAKRDARDLAYDQALQTDPDTNSTHNKNKEPGWKLAVAFILVITAIILSFTSYNRVKAILAEKNKPKTPPAKIAAPAEIAPEVTPIPNPFEAIGTAMVDPLEKALEISKEQTAQQLNRIIDYEVAAGNQFREGMTKQEIIAYFEEKELIPPGKLKPEIYSYTPPRNGKKPRFFSNETDAKAHEHATKYKATTTQ